MKKKILGIFVCMLLVATAVPAVESFKNGAINPTVPSAPLPSMGGNWTEMQKLLASDGATGDSFGFPVALSGDTALIGESYDNGDKGSAYVFTRTGTTWTQQAKLLASDGAAGDYFGQSVSLVGDTALIGAFGADSAMGSAYAFTRTGTTWTQQAKLLASDGAADDWFGGTVSLAGDTALIGTPQDNDNGAYSGSAYVFTRTGTTWTQQQKLLASDGAVDDYFGLAVSLYGDTALIGAPLDDDNGVDSGSVYVFTRTGTTWTQQQKLLASDGATSDEFGRSVSLAGDTALIGTPGDDDNGVNSGSAYVFIRTGTTWTRQAKFLASDGAVDDYFGLAVSLYGDTALIGACGKNGNTGSAYVLSRTGTTWTQQQKLIASDGATSDEFGRSVSLAGDTALIGAYGDDGYKGSAYVFINEKPPNPPTITGPASGKAGQPHNYSFNTTDPNGDHVDYFIDWGDNTSSGWHGPYPSGHEITQSHTWTTKGTYTIKAKADDIYGDESDWTTLSVTMPYSYNIPFLPFWQRLFERFPHAFPILRQLLEY